MKFGTILKKILIFLILLICIATVIPLLCMLAGVADNGFRRSMLGEFLAELEN